ncbi:hypothetical protein CTAYLR_007579 [Chrysophaeum taylorii]|uniref:TauD/TfdA-like domain-containing protein n=1 Tax=Chrysophaeum taylorii TaxID=2483200 RepID=A0AAD7UE23_9STRA|nr:hypothetical protein CTAYLR_007579 [Chrysophaeum taylorii]
MMLIGKVVSLVVFVGVGVAVDVRIEDDGLAISLDGVGRVHAEWLRERCTSALSVDQVTLQRLHAPHEYEPPRVLNATIQNELLEVTFADFHASSFKVEELARQAVDDSIKEAPSSFIQFPQALRPELELWTSNLTLPPMMPYAEILEPKTRLRLYALLQSTGVVLARGAPREERVCSGIAAKLSTLRVTEWGENFDVRSVVSNEPNVKRDLAYTPKAIGMHTDNPYRYPTPDFQLLHAIDQCECEVFPCDECTVRNYFVDGFAIAERLATEDPELFDALATVPVRFENNGGDGTSALWHVVPHFELKPQFAAAMAFKHDTPVCRGARCLQAIRFSAKSGGYAPRLPPDELEIFYKAKRRFSELAHDPSMVIELQLRRGDIVIFDNKRLLHARSAILPSDGDRFVQGCYLDRDGIFFHYERARRELNENPLAAPWTSLANAPKPAFDEMGAEYAKIDVARNLASMLEAQVGLYLGQPVDLMEHGLQTASRAFRAGESDDLVVAGLFHDVTEHLVPKGHGEAAAALLAPYVDPATHWLLTHHEVFQGYYYFHHFGADRNTRDALRDSPHWELARRWCHDYDQAAFDPSYPSLPLDFLMTIANRVLSREPYWWNPAHLKRVAITG